ncbi:MAG: DNA alkylation repair protein [Bradymonadia bacterium]
MALSEVMQALEAAGKPGTVAIYRRHGVQGETFGVSVAALKTLTKLHRRDDALAMQLWETGNHDARVLATQIVEPRRFSPEVIEAWSAACDSYPINDAVCALAAKSPEALTFARSWIEREADFGAAAGWTVYSALVTKGKVEVDEARGLLERIVAGIHQSGNRTRYSMNNTLIAIGGTLPELQQAAIDAAEQIGPVVVDHGETGCQTPEAIPYIERMVARRAAKAGK